MLCVEFAKSHDMSQDVPFSTFVTDVSACQFVSQEVRVEMWIRNILLGSEKVLVITLYLI
jgi:hypothetical protein